MEPTLSRLLWMGSGLVDVAVFSMTFAVFALAVADELLVKPIEPGDTGHQETQ